MDDSKDEARRGPQDVDDLIFSGAAPIPSER